VVGSGGGGGRVHEGVRIALVRLLAVPDGPEEIRLVGPDGPYVTEADEYREAGEVRFFDLYPEPREDRVGRLHGDAGRPARVAPGRCPRGVWRYD